MPEIPLITQKRIDDARTLMFEFYRNHGWNAIKAHDEYYDVDSEVGKIKLKFNFQFPLDKPNEKISDESFSAFTDIMSYAFFMVNHTSPQNPQILQGDELIQSLASTRVQYHMYHPTPKNPAYKGDNESQKYMLQRLGFDKFVEGLGGKVLLHAVLDKARQMMPDAPFLA